MSLLGGLLALPGKVIGQSLKALTGQTQEAKKPTPPPPSRIRDNVNWSAALTGKSPPMRIFLMVFALAGLALAQGMFDLFEGTWVGKSPEGQRMQLHTSSKVHEFQLEYGEHWVVRGEYRVTAAKGQPHVSFKPTSILEDGHSRKYVEVEKWPFKVGAESRAILDYQDKKLQVDVFGPEIEFYWRAELVESP